MRDIVLITAASDHLRLSQYTLIVLADYTEDAPARPSISRGFGLNQATHQHLRFSTSPAAF